MHLDTSAKAFSTSHKTDAEPCLSLSSVILTNPSEPGRWVAFTESGPPPKGNAEAKHETEKKGKKGREDENDQRCKSFTTLPGTPGRRKTMRSFVAYPAATLLVLLAVIETGLCRKALPCPAHCSASLTVFMPDGSTTSVHGSKAVEVIRFKEEISRASWKHLVVIKVANTKIRVPPSLETMIRLVVKKYPDLGQVLIQIIMGEAKNQQKYTYMKGPNKNVGTTTKTRTITKGSPQGSRPKGFLRSPTR
uniref:Putative immunoglobulin g binding protein a n=1 Tax=Rhipicephalus microplus TaxID=6941 RepID=A0A6G5AG56_RHIMP